MFDSSDWPLGSPRTLRPGQRAEVWIVDVADWSARLVYTSETMLLEAPNWAPDGDGLLLNGNGLLWRLDLRPTVQLQQVISDGLPPINNDHVLDAPRGLIYLSANDGHIYVAPIGGGTATPVTHDSSRYHFLHGVSPDGKTLAFVDLPAGDMSAVGPCPAGVWRSRGAPGVIRTAAARPADPPPRATARLRRLRDRSREATGSAPECGPSARSRWPGPRAATPPRRGPRRGSRRARSDGHFPCSGPAAARAARPAPARERQTGRAPSCVAPRVPAGPGHGSAPDPPQAQLAAATPWRPEASRGAGA